MPKPRRGNNLPIGNERRLEALAVQVLIVLGGRDGGARHAELRAGGALLALSHNERL